MAFFQYFCMPGIQFQSFSCMSFRLIHWNISKKALWKKLVGYNMLLLLVQYGKCRTTHALFLYTRQPSFHSVLCLLVLGRDIQSPCTLCDFGHNWRLGFCHHNLVPQRITIPGCRVYFFLTISVFLRWFRITSVKRA